MTTHIDAALSELEAQAREQDWLPNVDTLALWRSTLEALFDPLRIVLVVPFEHGSDTPLTRVKMEGFSPGDTHV